MNDIKPEWLSVARAAQAACANNHGYGVVNVTVVVTDNRPIMWMQPELKKVHPKSAAIKGISEEVFASLVVLGLIEVSKTPWTNVVD